MAAIEQAYRSWILSQQLQGFSIEAVDADHIRLTGKAAFAEVNFYLMEPGAPEIVELRIEETASGNTTFFLHFELEDEARAQQLFTEMAEALATAGQQQTVHVLLCCTTGMTTSMFAARMNEAVKVLSVDYEFSALPLEQAIAEGTHYAAVLLAPQVGHRRREVVAACPDAVVLELPAKVFAAYDAGAAVRLVLDALESSVAEPAPEEGGELRLARDLDPSPYRILLVSVIHGTRHRCSSRMANIGYRLLEHGIVTMEGEAQKLDFTYQDVEDALTGIALKGVALCKLDAIAISLPGTVIDGTVSMPVMNLPEHHLAKNIQDHYHVPTIVENNARAAAIACYVAQDSYESIVFHTQRTGAWVGGEGNVVEGRALRGRASQSGEIGPIANRLLSHGLATDMAWSPEGMCVLIADFLISNVCALAPEAAYIACDLVDLDLLHEEMAKVLPERCIPDLYLVKDYRERSYLGMLALALQELAK